MEERRDFKLLSRIRGVTEIARGRGIRVLKRLVEAHGGKNWRKLKGIARVERDDGWIGDAKIHWYEAHGVGRV
ncbi:MAG TPA: hypothetical protein PLD59_11260 [Tepidisphaeraceae bacterium]|nr:hypothetical protein [Tepidisphaeraceae bacterium]